jgi:hypothetical protein
MRSDECAKSCGSLTVVAVEKIGTWHRPFFIFGTAPELDLPLSSVWPDAPSTWDIRAKKLSTEQLQRTDSGRPECKRVSNPGGFVL